MTVRITLNDKGTPVGKLADAELHCSDGPLEGMKLIGFSVWERRGDRRNVTFPSRQYSVGGVPFVRPTTTNQRHGPPGTHQGVRSWKPTTSLKLASPDK